MATGIDTSAVLSQAKAMYNQANSTLKKETGVEKSDMKKAESIFNKAQKIATAANSKSTNVLSNVNGKLDAKKGQIDAKAKDININKQIIEEQTKLIKEKTDKKAELEKTYPGLKEMNLGKLQKNQGELKKHKVTAPTKTNGSKKADKANGNTQGEKTVEVEVPVSDSKDGGSASIPAEVLQEYLDINNELSTIQSILMPATAKLEQGQSALQTLADDLNTINESGINELQTLDGQIQQDIQAQVNNLNPLISSQATSAGITQQTSTAADTASSSASSAASQTKDQNLQQQLTDISNKLDKSSQDLSKLSNTSTANYKTNIPNKADQLGQAASKVDADIGGSIDNLISSYQDYMTNNVLPLLGQDGASPDGTTAKATVGSDATSGLKGAEVTQLTGAATSIINGADIGSTAFNTGISMATQALDTYMPGLGSVVSSVLGTLGSIFGF